MLNKKELTSILVVTLILGFAISLIQTFELFLYSSLFVFIVIIANVIGKKVMAFHLDSEIELSLWEIKRYGFKKHKHFRHPFPAGAFFPIITTAFSLGYIKWMACLVFDVKAKVYRAARRHGIYKFSEIPESHIGRIAAAGILANFILAILAYLINQPEIARLSLYYACFNMLPVSDLDGNKIFFGSFVLWTFLVSISLIGLLIAVFMI